MKVHKIFTILKRPFGGRAAILCFHRILPDKLIQSMAGPNAEGLCYGCNDFEILLSWLSSKYLIVSLDQLEAHLNSNSKAFVIALTFDDGYKDNLDYALPLLEKYSCPATIYIATRFIELDTHIWWFELWNYIEQNEQIDFSFQSEGYYFCINTFPLKVESFMALKKLFLSLRIDAQNELLAAITKHNTRKTYKDLFLSWEDIRILDKNPLITIAAHTNSHISLAIADETELQYELIYPRSLLEEKLKHDIIHFAYPYGNSTDANQREYDAVRRAGYKTGVTLRTVVMGGDDLVAIARIPILKSSNLKSIAQDINSFRFRSNYLAKVFKYLISFLEDSFKTSK